MQREIPNSIETSRIADAICRDLSKAKTGTPRFWGVWFGRPYDSFLKLARCRADANVLHLYFDDDEHLTIWTPSGLVFDKSTFRIADADRVLWEWFYYGRPKTSSNLLFEDYVKSSIGVDARTNVDWYSSLWRKSRLPRGKGLRGHGAKSRPN
ncbi:hypothetical protein [Paludibaculum fermentans]|uniref:Uncharacterized protein n=1 Tax=Paludibaculum fermentans TaxID=1473598 RepID=A0A7S7NV06_PALFE|nr:hypothetical protein [Paludibaculum fermentans]QOY90320.1 hypothetical protein IRI77_10295 [Paludibaculum fermentans]